MLAFLNGLGAEAPAGPAPAAIDAVVPAAADVAAGAHVRPGRGRKAGRSYYMRHTVK